LSAEGEVLIDGDQTADVFSQLRPRAGFRSQFCYNNIRYALLGELISQLTGQSYHTYLKENILDPLSMTRTIVTKDGGLPDNTSLASAL
jgi:CubicO group peptidase (beta-lactamase class C family)